MKQRIVRLSGELMKTGQDVTQPGLYVSECCGEEVLLEKDASFPRCRRCNGRRGARGGHPTTARLAAGAAVGEEVGRAPPRTPLHERSCPIHPPTRSKAFSSSPSNRRSDRKKLPGNEAARCRACASRTVGIRERHSAQPQKREARQRAASATSGESESFRRRKLLAVPEIPRNLFMLAVLNPKMHPAPQVRDFSLSSLPPTSL